MQSSSTTQEHLDSPTWEVVDARRRPWTGLALLGGSIVFTFAVLVFFGAWFATDRIDARSDALGHEAQGDWWEDGLITVCPIH